VIVLDGRKLLIGHFDGSISEDVNLVLLKAIELGVCGLLKEGSLDLGSFSVHEINVK